MKLLFLSISALVFTLFSCKKVETVTPLPTTDQVLILKVDYTTNTFEGAKELTFATNTADMTIKVEYEHPIDFGGIILYYKELNEILFSGSIVWLGTGGIGFPQNFVAADQFFKVNTTDFVTPVSGFENVFNPDNKTYDYTPIWSSIQNLAKVRAYLKSNPKATVKLFLYTPSVGVGNPAEWDWIVMMKN